MLYALNMPYPDQGQFVCFFTLVVLTGYVLIHCEHRTRSLQLQQADTSGLFLDLVSFSYPHIHISKMSET